MAVSVPQQPTTSTLRVFFFLYVCFCFAISTVFQAFFVSYLVEPMYEKKLETLDELLQSDVVYSIHPSVSFVKGYPNIPEFVDFVEQKRLKEDCSDLRKCVERMIKETLLLLLLHIIVTNVARDLRTVDVGKIICSNDDNVMSAGVIFLNKKINLLLDIFNILCKVMDCYQFR
jgi:hypothetical protein